MIAFLQVFFLGLGVSFLGQIPMGNMNMVATQISMHEGWKCAWKFGWGVAIIEVIYLRIALSGMDWVIEHVLLFKILTWATVLFFLILGILSLISAAKKGPPSKGVIIDNKVNRFLLGVSLSAINPLQIPFWFTWTITLFNNGLLPPGYGHYNWFTIGAGMGTLAGIGVYIHGGKWALQKTGAGSKTLNYILGVVFIVAALVQLYRNIHSPWNPGS